MTKWRDIHAPFISVKALALYRSEMFNSREIEYLPTSYRSQYLNTRSLKFLSVIYLLMKFCLPWLSTTAAF